MASPASQTLPFPKNLRGRTLSPPGQTALQSDTQRRLELRRQDRSKRAIQRFAAPARGNGRECPDRLGPCAHPRGRGVQGQVQNTCPSPSGSGACRSSPAMYELPLSAGSPSRTHLRLRPSAPMMRSALTNGAAVLAILQAQGIAVELRTGGFSGSARRARRRAREAVWHQWTRAMPLAVVGKATGSPASSPKIDKPCPSRAANPPSTPSRRRVRTPGGWITHPRTRWRRCARRAGADDGHVRVLRARRQGARLR
jgi:hypothetical protein